MSGTLKADTIITGLGATFALDQVQTQLNNKIETSLYPSSFTDSTAGELLKVGSFGVGDIAINLAGAAWTTVATYGSGFYMCYDAPDSPLDNTWFIGEWVKHNPKYGVLKLTSFTVTAGRTFYRNLNNGTWGSWYEFHTTQNNIGTVVTGGPAIIEYGSNANGKYTRFVDGTQICTRTVELTMAGVSDYTTASINTAAAFIDTSWVAAVIGTGAVATYASSNMVSIVSASTFSITVKFSAAVTATRIYQVISIGRWQ